MKVENTCNEALLAKAMTNATRDRFEMSIDLLDAVLCVDPTTNQLCWHVDRCI